MAVSKVLVCDPLDEAALARLRARAEVSYRPEISPEELLEAVAAYDAVIVRSRTRLTGEVLARAEKLRVIGRAGSGLDNIDLDAARARGVVVLNVPGANANAVAELTLALMLLLARRLTEALDSVRAGKPRKVKGIELQGKALGLVGFGHVGRRVAELARGLGMTVQAHDPRLDLEQVPAPLRVVPLCGLAELLEQSDFVSLHLPLQEDTRGLIDAATLRHFKAPSFLINTARGPLVDEAAVRAALEEGRLAGYASDFYRADSPLQGHPRALFTPHIGASSLEAQRRAGEQIARRVLAALEKTA